MSMPSSQRKALHSVTCGYIHVIYKQWSSCICNFVERCRSVTKAFSSQSREPGSNTGQSRRSLHVAQVHSAVRMNTWQNSGGYVFNSLRSIAAASQKMHREDKMVFD